MSTFGRFTKLLESHADRLSTLLKNDPFRMDILRAVSTLALPDCWVAAGFVRNLVWDHLHNTATSLNDVDVVYYCHSDTQSVLAEQAQVTLQILLPAVNWQVKNQAMMHSKSGQKAYLNSTDAMTYWPEEETAVGVRVDKQQVITIIAPFGLSTLFAGHITYNPKADKAVFHERIRNKSWLTIWPKLVVR